MAKCMQHAIFYYGRTSLLRSGVDAGEQRALTNRNTRHPAVTETVSRRVTQFSVRVDVKKVFCLAVVSFFNESEKQLCVSKLVVYN